MIPGQIRGRARGSAGRWAVRLGSVLLAAPLSGCGLGHTFVASQWPGSQEREYPPSAVDRETKLVSHQAAKPVAVGAGDAAPAVVPVASAEMSGATNVANITSPGVPSIAGDEAEASLPRDPAIEALNALVARPLAGSEAEASPPRGPASDGMQGDAAKPADVAGIAMPRVPSIEAAVAEAIKPVKPAGAEMPDASPADAADAAQTAETKAPVGPDGKPLEPGESTGVGARERFAPVTRTTPTAEPAIPPSPGKYPIDLDVALRLAEAQNPTIGRVRMAVMEALALQTLARTLLVPSLNAGANYHDHTGNLQRSSGKILRLNEQSLYFGGGSRTLAAESLAIPAVNIFSPLTDAIYEPLAARQRVANTRYTVAATSNQILLDVSVLYMDLIAAQKTLEMQRLSESQTITIARYTTAFANSGQGRPADANRALTEWKLRRAEVQTAEAEVAIASARLAERLNLDPAVRLEAAVGSLHPLHLIDLKTPQQNLLEVALRRRPEMGATTAEIAFAEAKVKEEIARPLLPTIWLGFSGGAFGGGSNLVFNNMGHFMGRTDFDVRCYWTVSNLGVGNLALIKERKAQAGQAVAEQGRMVNRIRAEVSSSLAEGLALKTQMDIATRQLRTAEEGFEEDRLRARDNLGKPIEVLNNMNLLADARVNFVRAVMQYNQAQLRLFVALGSPPPLGAK